MIKTEARGQFRYDTECDGYELTMFVPCGDHDGKIFKDKDAEFEYYKSKMEYLLLAFLKTPFNICEFKIEGLSDTQGDGK